ncbi:hypothetical protein GCM10022198_22240 [Klugiella xanthotipulae]|uniref:Immunity protein 52 domain-containing protein n=1 Tax=Klugiella xanthotipulae TaxID=244735 RepID=A0A543I5Y8_9MICO|nr:hypothetical protein [Klugiella xanthotipulae]TQM65984.1 hypothetical protein FB466_0804 [Klugiella xanthotipulae]
MNTQHEYFLHGFWGGRPVTVDDTVARIKASFEVLKSLGEPLSGPWKVDYTNPIDVSNEDAIRTHVLASPVLDDVGEPVEGGGYIPSFELGNFQVPNSIVNDLGQFNVSVSPYASTVASRIVLSFEGDGFTVPAREHAEVLVRSFARIWQPEHLAFTDHPLLDLRHERISRTRTSGLPSWGYVSWVSDRVSRQLETVDGATTAPYGTGTLVTTDTWDAKQAADVWRDLLDSKRLRAIPELQEHPPTFP